LCGTDVYWDSNFVVSNVIDGFIVDFYCPELKLVLEIDGRVHEDPENIAYDAARSAHLELRAYW